MVISRDMLLKPFKLFGIIFSVPINLGFRCKCTVVLKSVNLRTPLQTYLQSYLYTSILFLLQLVRRLWEGWDRLNRFSLTSLVASITPTDRLKSVRNRCVIEVFGGVFVLSSGVLDFASGVGIIVIGLSQISSFFLLKENNDIFRYRMYLRPIPSIVLCRPYNPEHHHRTSKVECIDH